MQRLSWQNEGTEKQNQLSTRGRVDLPHSCHKAECPTIYLDRGGWDPPLRSSPNIWRWSINMKRSHSWWYFSSPLQLSLDSHSGLNKAHPKVQKLFHLTYLSSPFGSIDYSICKHPDCLGSEYYLYPVLMDLPQLCLWKFQRWHVKRCQFFSYHELANAGCLILEFK